MRRHARAAVIVAAIACLGACTMLLGSTDVPNLASDASGGDEAGDEGAQGDERGGFDATGKDAADGGGEAACVNTCLEGATQCQGEGVETCVTASNGCTGWGATVTCSSGQCAGAACTCTPVGAKQCSGNGVETCGADGGWSSAMACGTSQNCNGGACVTPPSCAAGDAGTTRCGVLDGGSESCCTSLEVPGGTYDRSYDHVTFTDPSYPATVSGFRLDKYEVTVGRFRAFVGAVVGGWLPADGSGRHSYLNGGAGLNATGAGQEAGWDAKDWNGLLATTSSAWNTNLACYPDYVTWTPSAGENENKPIDCVTWYEAYAFCIWDGGFLPSEAEWNYAAAAGGGLTGQRAYPWSSPSTATTIDCSHANYAGAEGGLLCLASGPNAVGSESPSGDGAFGQADLAGNVWEWNLDFYATPYVNPCPNCANLTFAANRVIRGASFNDDSTNMLVSTRYDVLPTTRIYNFGARCGRAP